MRVGPTVRTRSQRERQRIREENHRECMREIVEWIFFAIFCAFFYVYFDQIVYVIQKFKYKTLQLAGSKLFIPPPSIFKQSPEDTIHIPPSLFKTTNEPPFWMWNSTTSCVHTVMDDYSIDSQLNICKLREMESNGCCPKNAAIDYQLSYKPCAISKHPQLSDSVFKGDMCQCCNLFAGCVQSCVTKFIAKAYDWRLQSMYAFETCKLVCRTSSKSTIHSRYFTDESHMYCFGNRYFPSTEYGILGVLSPSFKIMFSENDQNCATACEKIRTGSKCQTMAVAVFGDDCRYHEAMTGTKCNQCVHGYYAPSITYANTSNQVCYRGRSESKACYSKPQYKDTQNICICSLL